MEGRKMREKMLIGEKLEGKGHLEDLDTDENIILK
jgi:hypothetical protein